jgi:hypothetical protein
MVPAATIAAVRHPAISAGTRIGVTRTRNTPGEAEYKPMLLGTRFCRWRSLQVWLPSIIVGSALIPLKICTGVVWNYEKRREIAAENSGKPCLTGIT